MNLIEETAKFEKQRFIREQADRKGVLPRVLLDFETIK